LPQKQPGSRVIARSEFMTEEKARHYATALAQSMGITFYVVRSREGRYLSVQRPSDDCEVLATVAPPGSARDTPQFRPGKLPD
jgi:hypothetical protein